MQKCKICNSSTTLAFTTTILHKYQVHFYKCSCCEFLFADTPYWLQEAYSEAINLSDTGIILRNQRLSKLATCITVFFFGKTKKILDWGGGYGILVRMLRDVGIDAFWFDKYATNIFAKTFEYNNKIQPDIITCFEVFEHLPNPIEEIEKMLNITPNILFSTLLLPEKIPPIKGNKKWWYYGFEHGQHISFFAHNTLKTIAKKYNLNLYSFQDIHLLTKNSINHSLFKLFILLSNKGLFSILRLFLKSKTMEDSKRILNNR